jgi:tetrahydromethanopterin S-methyltransferase subunit E
VEVALVGKMVWIVLTPLLSKWLGAGFTLLVLTLVLSHLFAHVLIFEFQVGDLKNIWLIDSGCSRHMTGDKGWFSSPVLVVTWRYITFGDNGRGCVLSEGEIKVRSLSGVLLLFNRLDTICFLCPSYWMRALRCCFGMVVLGFWTLEGTLSVWSFPRVRYFELILLSLLVLSVICWLVLRVSCASGKGSWVT